MTDAVSRRAVANLLRLAAVELDDAGLLHECGRVTPSIQHLAHAAWANLSLAVQVSEHGWPPTPANGDIPDENPWKARLAAAFVAAAASVLDRAGDGPPPPDLTAADTWLAGLSKLLQALVAQFEVTLDGDAPAGNARALRPPPEAPPPALVPPPTRSPAPAPSWAGTASSKVTSAAFWALMDRWGVGDLDALQLVGHGGGLSKAGARPRFALRGERAQTMAQLVEMDTALTALGVVVRDWLHTPIKAAPFTGGTPLRLMLAHRIDGIAQASRFILQQSLRSSMTT